jgi:hypothetical protein
MTIIVLDLLSLNIDRQSNLHFFPGQLTFRTDHPTKEFLGQGPIGGSRGVFDSINNSLVPGDLLIVTCPKAPLSVTYACSRPRGKRSSRME